MDVDSQTSDQFSSDYQYSKNPSFGNSAINYDSEIQPSPVLKKSQFSNNLRGHSKIEDQSEENSQMSNSFDEKEEIVEPLS